MKATVELVYDDKKRNRRLDVELKGRPIGVRLMNAIEKGVEKAAKNDTEWRRWNLVSVDE